LQEKIKFEKALK